MNKLLNLVRSDAISGTMVVTIASFIASIFSYLLQLFLGRSLSVENFGVFNTLLSFSVILGVFSGALSTAIVKKVAELASGKDFAAITKLFWNLSFLALVLGLVLFIPIYFYRFAMASFLNIRGDQVLIAFAAFMSLTFLSSLPTAYLQGLCRFKALSFYSVAASFFRAVLPAVLVLAGFKVSGVFGGMSLGIVGAYLLSVALLNKNFEKSEEVRLKDHYKSIASFLGPFLFLRVGITLLNNTDVILVKHFFSSEEAGIYAGLVTVGKVLLFGTIPVATVMFPSVTADFALGKNARYSLRHFLLVQVLLVFAGTVVFIVFPGLITLLMFGEKFLPAVRYLPKFAVFVAFYVLINFFVLFYVAVEKYLAILFLGVGVVLQAGLLWVFNDSLATVVNINILVSGVVLFCLFLYYMLAKFENNPV